MDNNRPFSAKSEAAAPMHTMQHYYGSQGLRIGPSGRSGAVSANEIEAMKQKRKISGRSRVMANNNKTMKMREIEQIYNFDEVSQAESYYVGALNQ